MLMKNSNGFNVIDAMIVPTQKQKQASQSIGLILLNGSTLKMLRM
jgi:hypothetical protein